jgi:hypothetical protein
MVEEYGKFGLSEVGYIGLARIAMGILRVGNLPSSIYENVKSVLTIATQSTIAQGTADLGLFSDLTAQGRFNDWSEELRDIVRNSVTFFISAASVAVTAFQMANPGVAGEISLGIIDLPYGFAAITFIGIGFYLHGLFTEWSSGY